MGALTSFLDWVDRPFQVIGHGLKGDFGTSGRHLLDFVGEVPDAILPGDVIPNATDRKDFMAPSELVGAENLPWYAKMPIDIALGTALNPLSFVTMGGAGAAGATARGVSRSATLAKAATSASRSADDAARAALKASRDRVRRGFGPPSPATGIRTPLPLSEAESSLKAARQRLAGIRKQQRRAKRDLGRVAPVDMATTAVPAFSGGRQSAAARIKALQVEADDATDAIRSIERGIKRSKVDDLATGAGEAAAFRSVRNQVDAAIKPSAGRKMNAADRRDLIDRVTREIGTDTSEANIRSVLRRPEFASAFNQGGVRLAGREVLSPEQLRAFSSKVGEWTPQRLKDFGESTWKSVKNGTGWNTLDAINESKLVHASIAVGANTARAFTNRAVDIFKGVSDWTDRVIAQAFDNIQYTPDGKVLPDATIVPKAEVETVDDVVAALDRLRQGGAGTDVDLSKVDWDRAEQAVRDIDEMHRWMWDDLREARAVGQPGDSLSEALGAAPTTNEGRTAYLMRIMDGVDPDDALDDLRRQMGVAKSAKGRTLKTSQDLRRRLSQGDVKLERSAARRVMERSAQQGRMKTQAAMYQRLLGDASKVMNDPAVVAEVGETMSRIAAEDPELGRVLANLAAGMKPRGASKALAKANRIFKPAAVYGVWLPRYAALTRNQVGGIWQVATTQGVGEAMRQIKRAPSNWYGAVAKATGRMFGREVKFSKGLAGDLEAVDDAFLRYAGDPAAIRRTLEGRNPRLVDALDAGVFEGFVDSEELLRRGVRSTPRGRVVRDLMDAPGVGFRHLEQSMRLGLFLDLRAGGMGADAAGQAVRDAFLDYSVSSLANRRVRDVLPFFAFTAGTIPQQAKALASRPAVAAGLSQLYGQDGNDLVMPYISDQPSFRVGGDSDGNQLFATSLGLPVEVLEDLPNPFDKSLMEFGREVEKSAVGSSHPLLKFAYSNVSGRDPFFGTTFGSYDRLFNEPSEFGRQYNRLASTGLIQPVETAVSSAEKLADDRKPALARLLNFATGVKLASNDPDRAAMRILQEELARNPRARQYTSYYGGDEDVETLISNLRDARRVLNEKRKAREIAESQ